MAEVIEPEVVEPTESGRRSVWVAAVLLFVVSVLTGVALSMWRPATFPRLRVLPQPAHIEFKDSCGRGVERFWAEGTLFWEHEDFVDLVPCRGDHIDDP